MGCGRQGICRKEKLALRTYVGVGNGRVPLRSAQFRRELSSRSEFWLVCVCKPRAWVRVGEEFTAKGTIGTQENLTARLCWSGQGLARRIRVRHETGGLVG